MGKYFNTEGPCRSVVHYMAKLDNRLEKIKRRYVDRGKYFVINRGMGYGKTTTLMALEEYLKEDYGVIAIDFQLADTVDEPGFVTAFIEELEGLLCVGKELTDCIDVEVFDNLRSLKDGRSVSMSQLFWGLSRLCGTAKKPLVLIVDDADDVSNHQVFLDFLAMLRGYYLRRDTRPAFHSVILAGVYDIRNLKSKAEPEADYPYNSPWNIAADFDIQMNLPEDKIREMLDEYEVDHHMGMDTEDMAGEIYQYTSGHPYLVSAICKRLDEKLLKKERTWDSKEVWTRGGVSEAVKDILKSNIQLFDSMAEQLDTFGDLRDMVQGILYQDKKMVFNPDIRSVSRGIMFGFLKEEDGLVVIANRIFEIFLRNLFVVESSVGKESF